MQARLLFGAFFVLCSLIGCTTAPVASDEPVGTTAQALTSQSISIYPTGESATGALLANGAVDPHYQITVSSDPAFPAPRDAYAVTAGTIPSTWVAETSTAEWIAPNAAACKACTGKTYTYEYTTTFMVPANAASVTLTFSFAADDKATVYLNGVAQATPTNGYQSLTSMTITGGSSSFHFGTSNTLTFQVLNSGGTYSGLMVTAISGSSSTLCTADSQCASGQYCNGTTGACTATLPNGSSIPTDTIHAGTCTPTTGAAVCTSGVCDTTDNKCGYANGDPSCTTANQGTVCRSGVCGPDQECGYPNGTGPCTTANQTTVCRSGACGSSSLECVSAANGCNVDADCTTAGTYCNGLTNTCAPKLNNGMPIPNDGLHGGTCTATTGAEVCASGVCDTADNECGYANSDGPCTTANQGTVCRSQVCDTDSKCGYAVGDGPCTVANEGTVCRSSECGPTSLVCVPATNGCAADSDCNQATQFCDGNAHTCTAKLANSTPIPNDGIHNGTCTTGAGGTATSVCASGACDTDNACGYATGDGPCTVATPGVCRSGTCGAASGECIAAGGCNSDADCSSSQYCNGSTNACVAKLANGSALVSDPLHPVATCPASVVECASGACDANGNVCGVKLNDGMCTSSSQCITGSCAAIPDARAGTCVSCLTDSACASPTPVCNAATDTCVACTTGEAGACGGTTPACNGATNTCNACGSDFGGAVAACPSSANPLCLSTGACGKCATNDDCAGHAGGPVCNTTTGACGAACTVDADCASTSWCDNPSGAPFAGSCSPKVQNGSPLPNDAPINGTCSATAGARVCTSGVCSTADNDCGLPNSATCTMAGQCRSGECNADGACGDPNGTPCTQASTCRSAVCDTDGKCGEPNGEACGSASVCRSTVCDSADDACGALNGKPCTTATTCRSSVCYVDGACGYPDGQACTSGDVCRSGACVGGTCAATCTTDAQCPTHDYCDTASKSCQPAATNGTKPGGQNCTRGAQCLSNECNADGACGDPNGANCTTATTCRSAVCTGGVCGTGLPNGAPCVASALCASGICAADGMCGEPTSGPCTVATACRSGVCSGNVCATGCATDGDCPINTYCGGGATCLPAAANGQMPGGVACDRGAECLSGVCSPDGSCGEPNGQLCGSPLVCRSAVCDGVDTKCGYANSDGPCTAANATTVCRSAVCDTDNACGLANGSGPCTADAQCRGARCDTTTHLCVGCQTDADCPALTFCSTDGTCSPQVDNDVPCTRNPQCLTGACDGDGKCGENDGEPCTDPTQCRSNQCVNGTCGAPTADAGVPDAGGDAGTTTTTPTDAGRTTTTADASTSTNDAGAKPDDSGFLEGGAGCNATGAEDDWGSSAATGAVLFGLALSVARRRRPRA